MQSDSESSDTREDEPTPKVGLFQVIGSTLAAGLGVQSSSNRERDFKQGKLSTFIIAGLTFTLLFIGSLYLVVQMVLEHAGH
jgi:hypothetical protein